MSADSVLAPLCTIPAASMHAFIRPVSICNDDVVLVRCNCIRQLCPQTQYWPILTFLLDSSSTFPWQAHAHCHHMSHFVRRRKFPSAFFGSTSSQTIVLSTHPDMAEIMHSQPAAGQIEFEQKLRYLQAIRQAHQQLPTYSQQEVQEMRAKAGLPPVSEMVDHWSTTTGFESSGGVALAKALFEGAAPSGPNTYTDPDVEEMGQLTIQLGEAVDHTPNMVVMENISLSKVRQITRDVGEPHGFKVVPYVLPRRANVSEDQSLPGTRKLQIRCRDCNMITPASKTLIDQSDPGFHWQGSLVFRCLDCCQQGPPEVREAGTPWTPRFRTVNEFKKASSKAWLDKKYADGENVTKRVRVATWQAAVEDIGARYPGESAKLWRKRVLQATVESVAAITAAILHSSEEKKRQYMLALEQWKNTYEDIAASNEGVTSAGAPSEGVAPSVGPSAEADMKEAVFAECFFPDSMAQWLHEIVKGVDQYFICRRKDCLFVGLNSMWAYVPGGYCRFRCPGCGFRYQPWLSKASLIPAQKVLALENIHGLQLTRAGIDVTPQLSHAGVLSESAVVGSSGTPGISMYLCEWSDTTTQVLLNEFMAITAELKGQIRASTDSQIIKEIQRLTNHSKRSYFKPMPFPDSAKRIIEDFNNLPSTPVTEQFKYDHLTSGFQGMHYPYVEGEPVMSYRDTMRMIGLARYVVTKAVHSSRL